MFEESLYPFKCPADLFASTQVDGEISTFSDWVDRIDSIPIAPTHSNHMQLSQMFSGDDALPHVSSGTSTLPQLGAQTATSPPSSAPVATSQQGLTELDTYPLANATPSPNHVAQQLVPCYQNVPTNDLASPHA